MASSTRTLEQATASHDNGFNLVRLACATMVVVYHAFLSNSARPNTLDPASTLLRPVTDLGALAVGVFFLISGIFIAQSWERDPHLPRYLLRRAARILPGLAVCLLLMVTLEVVFFSSSGWRGMLTSPPWRFIIGNAFLHGLVYNIPPEELRVAGVMGGEVLNGSLWTLYWEARMYVLVALVGLAAALPLRTWMRGAAIFLLAAANLFPEVLSGYLWEVRMWSLFLTGMLLHTLGRDLRVGPRQVLVALALIGLNWTRSSALTDSPLTWFGVALAAGSLALWAGTARQPFTAHVRRHDYSYGIYIYHWPVLMMLRTAFAPLGPKALLLIGLPLTVLLAMLSWHLVEAPALRAARHWLGKSKGARTAAIQ